MAPSLKQLTTLIAFTTVIAGCQNNLLNTDLLATKNDAQTVEPKLEILSSSTKSATMSDVAEINETLDASVMEIPTINAVGYAVVSSQPGRTENQKRLMAIRSARMAAMRELAEQIHG